MNNSGGSNGSIPPGSSASERAKLRMKLFSSNATTGTVEASSSSNDNDDSSVNYYTSPSNAANTRGDGVKYNHFTTPFTPTTATPMTNDNMQQQHSQQRQQTSVFSDLERSQTVDRFINVLTTHLSIALSSGKLAQAWKPPSATKDNTVIDYYAMERNIIMPHITPFVWGGTAMIVTLFSLRFGRWYQTYLTINSPSSSSFSLSSWSSRVGIGGRINNSNSYNSSSNNSVGGISNMIRRYIDGSSGSKYSHHPNQRNMPQQQHPQQHGMNTTVSSSIQDVRQQSLMDSMKHNNTAGAGTVHGGGRGEDVFQSIGSLLVDISLSILFGISTTLFLIDRYHLLQDVATLPLWILNDNNNDNDNETATTPPPTTTTTTTASSSIGSSSGGSRNVNKSVIVEELCVPFSIEMDKINASSILVQQHTPHHCQDHEDKEDTEVVSYIELWKDENLNDYITLRSIRDFVTNCHIYDKMKRESDDEVE